MSETLRIKKLNETYLHITCDDVGVLYELNEVFTFEVPGARFMPKYKMGVWDGKINLFHLYKKIAYVGLLDEVKKFCETRGYQYEFLESPAYGFPDQKDNIHFEDIKEYVDSLNIHSNGKKLEVRDYQYNAVYEALKNKRLTILSPTGSGKSLIQYCITKYLLDQNKRVLIIVPTISLVKQMLGDFCDYASEIEWNPENDTHIIMGSYEKNSNKILTISTWQSIYKLQNHFFNSFDCIICDEVHLAKASSLTKIMEKSTEVPYRFGLTGTLDNIQTNKLVIKGLFGPIIKMASTKKLIDEGHLSEAQIKALLLYYNEESKALAKRFDYKNEIDFIIGHEKRNKFIRNLALSLEGNTLVLFTFVEKHGKVLYDLLKEKVGDRKLFFVYGETDAESREQVRHLTEQSNNAIILASAGTFSTGTNIKKLHNIIFASPTKSVIRVLQSLGRGLRKAEGKEKVKVFDIGDVIIKSKHKGNYAYKHFKERLAIYTKENFDYSIIEVKLE